MFYVFVVLFFILLVLVVLGAKYHYSGFYSVVRYLRTSVANLGRNLRSCWWLVNWVALVAQVQRNAAVISEILADWRVPQLLEVALGNRNWRWEAIPFPPLGARLARFTQCTTPCGLCASRNNKYKQLVSCRDVVVLRSPFARGPPVPPPRRLSDSHSPSAWLSCILPSLP